MRLVYDSIFFSLFSASVCLNRFRGFSPALFPFLFSLYHTFCTLVYFCFFYWTFNKTFQMFNFKSSKSWPHQWLEIHFLFQIPKTYYTHNFLSTIFFCRILFYSLSCLSSTKLYVLLKNYSNNKITGLRKVADFMDKKKIQKNHQRWTFFSIPFNFKYRLLRAKNYVGEMRFSESQRQVCFFSGELT